MRALNRIIFVTELFFPDESSTSYLLTKIVQESSSRFDILVLTGPNVYECKSQFNETSSPIDLRSIVRLWIPPLSKNKLFERLIRLLLLTAGIGWYLIRKSRSSDIIFAVTNPAPSLLILALISKIRRFRLVFLVHDVFPENAAAAGMIRRKGFLYPLIKSVFDWAYSSAYAVITIGRDMSALISSKVLRSPPQIKLIENWADNLLIKPITRCQSLIPSMCLSEHIVIQYSGNIGRAQGLIEFVRLVSTVQNNVVKFVFRGSGALTKELYEATQFDHKFILQGSYLRSEQSMILASCDIALVILLPDMYGLAVPSKTYNILAAGKPILFLGPKNSEIYLLVKEHNLGWAFDWSEPDLLVEFLNNLSVQDLPMIDRHGVIARSLAESSYTEAGQLAKYISFFEESFR